MSKTVTRFSFLHRGLPGLGAFLLPLFGWGQSFTPGNLVVVSMGDGSTPLSANAAPVLLREYSISGAALNTYTLPTAVTGANRACTLSGTNNLEGALSLSGNGRYLLLGGYDAAVGTVNVTTTSSTNPASGLGYARRVIARVSADGTSNTTTNLAIYSAAYVQGVASVDGNSFWMGGGPVGNATGGIQYVPSLGATVGNVPIALGTVNGVRVPAVFGDKLYFSSVVASYVGVNGFSTALPTSGSTPSLSLPAANPYGFSIVPISPAVGDITAVAYVADLTAGIRKFVFNSTNSTWTAATPVALANATGVVATYDPVTGSMRVYATTTTTAAAGGGSLYSATDISPLTPTTNISTPALLATAPANTVFRGLAFAPAPLPAITALSTTTPPPGTSVTITGSGFYDGTIPLRISFNGTPATAFTINSPTQLTVTVPTGATNGNVTVTTQGGTASFTVYPLPVELRTFTAARQAGGRVALAWTTASEKNSAYFGVERSLDGKAFGPVAQVPAQGSSTQVHYYTNRDADAPASLVYYRLRQVDQDGSLAYSPVVAVAPVSPGEITLWPNPARETLRLLTAETTPYLVRNTLGQVVLTGTTVAAEATALPTARLSAGVYMLELQGSAGRLVRRFVKE